MMTSSNGNVFRVHGLCAGNSPVTGEFLAQRPVTRSLDVFFDLRLNKQLNKQSWDWWFETLLRSLWRHCNEILTLLLPNFDVTISIHQKHPPFTQTQITIIWIVIAKIFPILTQNKCSHGTLRGRPVMSQHNKWPNFVTYSNLTEVCSRWSNQLWSTTGSDELKHESKSDQDPFINMV